MSPIIVFFVATLGWIVGLYLLGQIMLWIFDFVWSTSIDGNKDFETKKEPKS